MGFVYRINLLSHFIGFVFDKLNHYPTLTIALIQILTLTITMTIKKLIFAYTFICPDLEE